MDLLKFILDCQIVRQFSATILFGSIHDPPSNVYNNFRKGSCERDAFSPEGRNTSKAWMPALEKFIINITRGGRGLRPSSKVLRLRLRTTV